MIPKETYKQVWFAMDACNSSGVIHSLDKWVDAIWLEARELGKGTAYVNSHPILVIVADKLLQLASIGKSELGEKIKENEILGQAYSFVLDQVLKGE